MTLSPTGTASARWRGPTRYPSDLVAALAERDVDEGWLALAYEVAGFVEHLDDAEHRALVLWILAVYGAIEAGSTLLPADEVSSTLRAMGVPREDADAAQRLALAPLAPGLGRVIAAPGVQDATPTPLVRDDRGVYPQAAWVRERRVLRWLSADTSAPVRAGPAVERALADVRDRPPTLGGRPMALNERQLAAVHASVSGRLTVISGGPGTGKTSIVVAILRALVRLGVAPSELALAAPTGKAKHRLQTSVAAALGALEAPAPEDLRLRDEPPQAQTLHRLLGWSPAQGDFAWGRRHRMPQRVVIVDEGSMIDLMLIDRLLEALRDDAQLVVLGDADQLPSVDVGAVFRDFVAAGGARAVRLVESYRMRADDPEGGHVYEVAQAINAGDVPAMDARLEARAKGDAGGVRVVEVSRVEELAKQLDAWVDRRLVLVDGRNFFHEARASIGLSRGVLDRTHVERLSRLLRHADAQRILCVTRSAARPTGVDAVNAHVRRALRQRRADDDREQALFRSHYWAPGDPVLVERSDYERNLWNGDFGVVVRTLDRGFDQLAVAFEPEPGHFVFHPVAALRGDITHAWAMTVHKAQGSELTEVMFVLPWDPIPLVTREIVYTAVSRARKAVTVVGPRAVLRQGVERRLSRRSGLV